MSKHNKNNNLITRSKKQKIDNNISNDDDDIDSNDDIILESDDDREDDDCEDDNSEDDDEDEDDDIVFDKTKTKTKSSDFSDKDIEEIRKKINDKNSKKRKLSEEDLDDSEDEFIAKCDIFNLPYSWDESVINESSFNSKKNVMNSRYNSFKNQLIEKQIDLPIILSLDNLLDSERNLLIEKYSLMINSDQDISTYVKIRDEIWSMIKYYQNSDIHIDYHKKHCQLIHFFHSNNIDNKNHPVYI
jgi:hypothetical protein